MLRQELIERYGSLKRASRVLKISPSFLSMVLNNKRKAPRRLIIRLESEGFDITDLEYNFTFVETPKEMNEEVFYSVVAQMKRLILRYDMLLQAEQMTNLNLRKEINELKRKLT